VEAVSTKTATRGVLTVTMIEPSRSGSIARSLRKERPWIAIPVPIHSSSEFSKIHMI
jgi:hypothetical protein